MTIITENQAKKIPAVTSLFIQLGIIERQLFDTII